jgi:hypothetical protein
MKNAIIIQGMPGKDEYYKVLENSTREYAWEHWLQNKLLAKEILAQIPEMPHPYEPNYKAWCEVFEQFKINNETILIGHSAGAGFIIRYLAENNISIDKVILVAPWLDPDKYLESLGCGDFFDFEFNGDIANKILNQINSLDIFYSTDDDENILKTIEILKQNFSDNENQNNDSEKINYHKFTNRGHFTTEPGYNNDTIPEVLDTCLR